jgi:uridylate kinase
MSGTPVKVVSGGGSIAAGTALAQTGLGMQFFTAIGLAVVATIGGALLIRSSRLNKAKLEQGNSR